MDRLCLFCVLTVLGCYIVTSSAMPQPLPQFPSFGPIGNFPGNGFPNLGQLPQSPFPFQQSMNQVQEQLFQLLNHWISLIGNFPNNNGNPNPITFATPKPTTPAINMG